MNKLKFMASLVVMILPFFILSCDNEPIDPALANQMIDDGGGGNGNGGGTSSGDYWPAALNNQWQYNQNGVLQSPMKMISVDNISGNTYYKFDNVFGQSSSGSTAQATMRLRKSSGDYYLKYDDLNISAGGFTGVQSGFEVLILKDYINVGGTWNGSYNQTTTYDNPILPVITMTTNYDCTILEKNNPVTVNGTTYNTTIKIRFHQITSISGMPASDVYSDYWFAKDVGMVKSITYSMGGTTTPQYTNELVSYIVN